MSNRVVNTLSGPGVEKDPARAKKLMEETGNRYRAYDVRQVNQSLSCDSRNRPPVLGALEVSKAGQVEMVSSSEGTQFQAEKALRLEGGNITGSRERFCPEGPDSEDWPDWKPVSKAESDKLKEQFSKADAGDRSDGVKREGFIPEPYQEKTDDMER